MANDNVEGGLRDHRVEFARESDFGSAPADPSFLKYSTTIDNVTWASDSTVEDRRGIGSADPVGFLKGPESHEVTLSYDMMKWFVDGSNNANDAAYDGLARDSDNLLPNSHTIVDREDKGSIDADQTVAGNTSYATRIYTVAKGALIDEVTVNGDPSDSQPVTIDLTYTAQKTRSYQFDQPSSSTLLTVVSDDNGDSSQTVTIENEGAGNSESVSLNGTTVESTSVQFADIDAIELSAETAGTVSVSVNDGTNSSPTEGDTLAELDGTSTYDGVEGDLGVPALGSGSHEADPSGVETFIGDTIDRGGNNLAYEISSTSVTVSNNIETTERASGYGMGLHPGNREITLEATMYGESMTHDMIEQHLQTVAKNVTWNMDGGSLQLDGAVLQDAGDRAAEEGQAVMTTDNSFQADGITIN
jgi:hypothetical protein